MSATVVDMRDVSINRWSGRLVGYDASEMRSGCNPDTLYCELEQAPKRAGSADGAG